MKSHGDKTVVSKTIFFPHKLDSPDDRKLGNRHDLTRTTAVNKLH